MQREPALHKKLKDALKPGERLLVVIKGYLHEEPPQSDRKPFFSSVTFGPLYFVGITTKHLILRRENVFGIKQGVQKIPLAEVKWADVTQDTPFSLTYPYHRFSVLWGIEKALNLFVPNPFKADIEKILDICQANRISPHSLAWNSNFTFPKFQPKIKPIWVRIGSLSTGNITFRIIFPGVIIFMVWLWLINQIYSGNPPLLLSKLGVLFVGCILVFSGIVMIIRKEYAILHRSSGRGKRGIFMSILWTLGWLWMILVVMLEP
ncbi:MAG TPA: hypothetical protein PK530_13265 [Anaerolineales bacterium]|nr:hypothetical protein [Anaerolineales bacterium]